MTQGKLYSGNRESWQDQFFSLDSLFLWQIKSHWHRRKEYPQLLADPTYAHLTVHHFQRPHEAEIHLNALRSSLMDPE